MFNGKIVSHFKSIGTEKLMGTNGFCRYEHIYTCRTLDIAVELTVDSKKTLKFKRMMNLTVC